MLHHGLCRGGVNKIPFVLTKQNVSSVGLSIRYTFYFNLYTGHCHCAPRQLIATFHLSSSSALRPKTNRMRD